MKKTIIILVLTIMFSILLSCVKIGTDPSSDNLTINDINTTLDSPTSVVVEWTTQENSSSNFYYGTSETSLDIIVSTSAGLKERCLNFAGLLPETTYYYMIDSSIGDNLVETEVLNFTTSNNFGATYSINGSYSYTQVTQTDGFFIVELWDDSIAFTGEPLEKRFFKTFSSSFEIRVYPSNSYKIRIFRDFNSDADYDPLTDAVVTTGTIEMTSATINIGNLVLIEP